MKNGRIVSSWCAFTAGLALLPTHAHALEVTVSAGYGAEYTDNAALTPDDEQSEWIHTPRISFTAVQDGPSTTASADYEVSRAMYQDNTYGDQTAAEGTASLSWRAIADRLTFDFSNASTQTTIDARTQDVPTNQQVTNTATAGATLSLDSFSNHKINLGYEYAVETAQKTDTDSRSQKGTLGYVIPIGLERRIQLNGSYGDVKYDSSQSIDYISKSGDLQFVESGDVIELDMSIGYTVFDQEDQTDDVSGTTGNLNILWNASPTTSVTASYERSIQDQSANVAEGIPEFGETFTDNSGVTTPYTLDAVTLGISTKLGYNTIDLTGYIDEQNYDDSGQFTPIGPEAVDQNTKGVSLGIGRALRPTLNAQLYAGYSTVDFKDDDGNQETYSTGLRVNWTRWRRLSISGSGEYEKRTSDVATEEYDEWRGAITLMYMLVGAPK